jgi:hypothetical protein
MVVNVIEEEVEVESEDEEDAVSNARVAVCIGRTFTHITYQGKGPEARALSAQTRTGEGWVIPCGNTKTCLPDAAYIGLAVLGYSDASLPRLRTLSVPSLGLDPMASWRSVSDAFSTLKYPFELQVTHK